MTKTKIVVHKKDALKKYLKVFHWILWQLVQKSNGSQDELCKR